MPMRSSSLANNPLAITRELDGRYDVVLQVRDNLDLIEQVAGIDFATILAELESVQDFTGITVVQGTTVDWDGVNKILTVPKGDKGDKGDTGDQGIQGPRGLTGFTGPQGAKGDTGATGTQGPKGFTGDQGPQGIAGNDGQDLTIEQIVYNGDGTFTWQFSDGTDYTTPNLKGPKGDKGDKGVKGDTGIGVHHIKGTSTTNPNGDFGISPFRDTYTVYGDANETVNLGYFVVANGVSDGMSMAVYDTNSNGIVDNSEKLGSHTPDYYVNTATNQSVAGNKTFSNNVTITGNLVVNGTTSTINSEEVLVKDNSIVINNGEVGTGVTAGEAGIVVDRGLAEDYKFVFTEIDDSFKIGTASNLQKVATREDAPVDKGVAIWDSVTDKFETTKNVDVNSMSYGGLGTTTWNADESTLDIVLPGATLQVGQETLVKVRAGVAIGNGKVVMATGSLGNSGRIVVGLHDGTKANSKRIIGVSTQYISNGADGFVTSFGKVRGINTTGSSVGEVWADGDILYVKPNDAGNLTKVMPLDTEINMPVAFVVNAHTNGTLFVRINGVDENHNAVTATKLVTARTISITGDVTGSVLFDGSANASITATVAANSVALGTDTTGNYVAGNTAGTGIVITGTAGEGWSPTISLANIGTAGTYKSVTVDAQGRITAGTNPTTIAGYGITDAYTKTEIGTLAEFTAALG